MHLLIFFLFGLFYCLYSGDELLKEKAMETIYIEDLGLEELGQNEMEKVDGGVIPLVVVGIIVIGLWPTKAY